MAEQPRYKHVRSYNVMLTRIFQDGGEERAETRRLKIIGLITDVTDARDLAREVGWIGHTFDKDRWCAQVQYEECLTYVDLNSTAFPTDLPRNATAMQAQIEQLEKDVRSLQDGKRKLREELQESFRSKQADDASWAKEKHALVQRLEQNAKVIRQLTLDNETLNKQAGVASTQDLVERNRLIAEKGQLNDLVKQLQSQVDVLKDVIQDKMS